MTVIVCTRDRAGRLGSCLAAVAAQDYPDFELIVVDNYVALGAVMWHEHRRYVQARLAEGSL